MGNKVFDQHIRNTIDTYQVKSQLDKEAMWTNIEKAILHKKKPFYKAFYLKAITVFSTLAILAVIFTNRNSQIDFEVRQTKKHLLMYPLESKHINLDIDSTTSATNDYKQDLPNTPVKVETPMPEDNNLNSNTEPTVNLAPPQTTSTIPDSLTNQNDSTHNNVEVKFIKKQIIIKDTTLKRKRVRRK